MNDADYCIFLFPIKKVTCASQTIKDPSDVEQFLKYLEMDLSFITRYISHPKHASLLIGVSNILCDIYGSITGQSAVIDELFLKMQRHVQREIMLQRDLLKMVGQIDSFMFQMRGGGEGSGRNFMDEK